MWQQMNGMGKATWDSFRELNQISTLSVERLTQQEFALMGDCARLIFQCLAVPLQTKDVPSMLGDESRLATEYGEKWIANAHRVWENYVQTQNALGQWLSDVLRFLDGTKVTEQGQQARTTPYSRPGPCSTSREASTFVVDDPMLALMTRFACGDGQLHFAHEEFMVDQLAAIHRYVAPFPAEQQSTLAIQWIEQHAERYRRAWQQKAVYAKVVRTRCPDCPLAEEGLSTNCSIHDQWLDLLTQYAADEISSKRYVEDTLRLLTDYKNRLKVSARRRALS